MPTINAVKPTRRRMNGRRSKTSPSGQIKSMPDAYPACIKVAIEDDFSKLTSNVPAIWYKIG